MLSTEKSGNVTITRPGGLSTRTVPAGHEVVMEPSSRGMTRRISRWAPFSRARQELNQTFTKLIREVGLDGRGARARPRPHDLRHAFTVRTLLDWHEAGEDIDRRMPLLSTYLGHVDPASTYWYLEAVPELLELISRRLEQLPEVLS